MSVFQPLFPRLFFLSPQPGDEGCRIVKAAALRWDALFSFSGCREQALKWFRPSCRVLSGRRTPSMSIPGEQRSEAASGL